MGFNNGYDSGYADALEDVRSGEVAGLGPVAETQGDGTAFNAGVLEGYDVERLLSATDLDAYLATLSDDQLRALVTTDAEGGLAINTWQTIYTLINESTPLKLASILLTILDTMSQRGLIQDA